MTRQAVVASSALSFTHQAVKSRQLPRPLSTRAKGDERSPAEQWLESLKRNSETVPSAITEFKFSDLLVPVGKTLTSMTPPPQMLAENTSDRCGV